MQSFLQRGPLPASSETAETGSRIPNHAGTGWLPSLFPASLGCLLFCCVCVEGSCWVIVCSASRHSNCTVSIRSLTLFHVYFHICTHTQIFSTYISTHMYTYMCINTHKYSRVYTMHTYMHAHMRMHAHMFTRIHHHTMHAHTQTWLSVNQEVGPHQF